MKPHTDFRGKFESGILKMLVIGLGKRHGADQVHSFGTRGLRDMLPESGKVILEKTKFLGGLAVLENANEETAKLEVVDRDDLYDREPALLDEARGLMGRLPFHALDVLIVGECGKNYSGAGIDPNVVGRMLIEASPEAETNNPRITRMGVLDVSPESHGNATGIGIADLTTTRAIAAIDQAPVPHEQPHRAIPVAVEAAHRLRDRPRGHHRLRGDLLAAGAREDQVRCDPQHARGGRPLGLRAARGRGESRARTCNSSAPRSRCRSMRRGIWCRRSSSRTV